jgi:hypothetical protein
MLTSAISSTSTIRERIFSLINSVSTDERTGVVDGKHQTGGSDKNAFSAFSKLVTLYFGFKQPQITARNPFACHVHNITTSSQEDQPPPSTPAGNVRNIIPVIN